MIREGKWLKQLGNRYIDKGKQRLDRRVSNGLSVNSQAMRMSKNIQYVRELKNKPTKAEVVVGDWLWKNNYHFTFQKGFLTPFHRITDFYLATKKLIIEVDGGYHLETVQKDKVKDDTFLRERGLKTIRITNDEVFDGSFALKLKDI